MKYLPCAVTPPLTTEGFTVSKLRQCSALVILGILMQLYH